MSGVPLIDAIGVYTVKDPFTLPNDAIYVCKAIESFEALTQRDVDVYNEYYVPNGLSETDYTRDRNANVKIVSLHSTTGQAPLTLPSSYIASFPAKSLVAYSDLVLSLGLGLVPDDVVLETLKQALAQDVKDILGIEPQVELHRLPLKGGVDFGTHQRLEKARAALMSYRPSYQAMQQYWASRIEALEADNSRLEEALINTQTP